MKKSIFILAAVALLAMVSCNNKAKENQNQESAATVALSVDDILAEGDSLVGKTVTVEGVCTHICKHGGKKLFMMEPTTPKCCVQRLANWAASPLRL